jgi:hypothetical protein
VFCSFCRLIGGKYLEVRCWRYSPLRALMYKMLQYSLLVSSVELTLHLPVHEYLHELLADQRQTVGFSKIGLRNLEPSSP